MLFPILALLID